VSVVVLPGPPAACQVSKSPKIFVNMVGRVGFEPTTLGLKGWPEDHLTQYIVVDTLRRHNILIVSPPGSDNGDKARH
jgi:hypothetical protein